MKKIYNFLLPLLFLLPLMTACDDGGEEVVNLEYEGRNISVTGVAPSSGYAGENMTISGTNFGISKELVKAYIGDDEVEVVSCDDNEIVVKVPESATTGKISLSILGNKVASDVMFIILGKPSVTSIEPLHGFVGDQIAFVGTNFGTNRTLVKATFAGMETTAKVVSCTNEKIVVEVPEGAATGKINLQISEQKVNTPDEFTVLERATFTGLSPESGFRKGQVTLTGTNFGGNVEGMTVLFGDKQATVVSCTNEEIVVTVPADAVIGSNVVSVETPYEKIETTQTFTVLPTPTVTSVSPAASYVGGTVTITGTGFGTKVEDVEIYFGTKQAEVLTCTATSITVKVPAPENNTFGDVDFILNILGLEIYKGEFTINETPIVNPLDIKLVKTGQTISITGLRLNTATVKVMFGSIETSPVSNTGTTIQVAVPNGFESGMVALKFDGIPDAQDAGELVVMKAGLDITQYVLKNYTNPFERVGDKYKSNEWAMPAIWVVENSALNAGDGGATVGLQYISKSETNTALVLQTDWGFATTKTNGKIYQVTTLPAGKFRFVANVSERNISGSAYLVVCEGSGIANTEDVATGTLGYTSVSNTGALSVDFELSAQKEISVGFVATLTAKQRYVKINDFKIEVVE
ncbi:IPT/TIG domain-containing protein [Dysgonomonas sp. 511]|uniref:IPT/TIG domain-containing protein n=1 Tax=Dysgonomonas sp. 511 TaxID=2302930 RepID=UPI0013D5AE46|nr:IPT/TIG domain-containing protein [Dysgonomonas sp. 511]